MTHLEKITSKVQRLRPRSKKSKRSKKIIIRELNKIEREEESRK